MPIHDWTRVDAGTFHDFHLTWIALLKTALNGGILPPDYYALAEPRAAETEPDVLALKLRESSPEETEASFSRHPGSSVALEDAPPKADIVTDFDTDFYTRKRRTIVIRHATGHDIIALIEIVSPGNKSSSHAFEQFINKILSALDQGIHVLLIDLHPPTRRDPRGLHAAIMEAYSRDVAGLDPARPLTLASYLAGFEGRAFVRLAAVGDQLAAMPLFLEKAQYVNVPLEDSYTTAFAATPRHLRAVLESKNGSSH